METEDLDKILFGDAKEKYGDKYVEHLLEQYKIYLNSAEQISDRRQKTNEFFLGLNTALVTLLGFFSTKSEKEFPLLIMFAAIAGLTLCYLWYQIIKSYKSLNGTKFQVVHLIERRLPLALYDTEWRMLKKGEEKKTYWPFSHIELFVPWIFFLIYFALLIFQIPWSRLFTNFCR